jgi:phosphoglycolate phosphatase-like HAD superfamily hydrolase
MKAAIFDRDGTLLDFRRMYLEFMLDLYVRHDVAPPDDEFLLSYDCWQRILSGELRIGPVRVSDRIDDVPNFYMHMGSFYPGVTQTLKALRDRGVATAIVSGWVASEATRILCRREDVNAEFNCILTRDDLGPGDHPAIGTSEVKRVLIGRALEQLGVAACDCAVIGDSTDDIVAGKALGARTVAVRTGNGQHLAKAIRALQPDHIIDSVADLETVLFPALPQSSCQADFNR